MTYIFDTKLFKESIVNDTTKCQEMFGEFIKKLKEDDDLFDKHLDSDDIYDCLVCALENKNNVVVLMILEEADWLGIVSPDDIDDCEWLLEYRTSPEISRIIYNYMLSNVKRVQHNYRKSEFLSDPIGLEAIFTNHKSVKFINRLSRIQTLEKTVLMSKLVITALHHLEREGSDDVYLDYVFGKGVNSNIQQYILSPTRKAIIKLFENFPLLKNMELILTLYREFKIPKKSLIILQSMKITDTFEIA